RQLRPDRRPAPVLGDRLPDLLTERVRRNCAVGARSEQTLVEPRGERREQLTLARAPLGWAPHHAIQRLRERKAEELGAVEQRLDDAERLVAAARPDLGEHGRLVRRVPAVDDGEPQPITCSAMSSRRSPSWIATATVCSKISSSERPAAFSPSSSASVIV